MSTILYAFVEFWVPACKRKDEEVRAELARQKEAWDAFVDDVTSQGNAVLPGQLEFGPLPRRMLLKGAVTVKDSVPQIGALEKVLAAALEKHGLAPFFDQGEIYYEEVEVARFPGEDTQASIAIPELVFVDEAHAVGEGRFVIRSPFLANCRLRGSVWRIDIRPLFKLS